MSERVLITGISGQIAQWCAKLCSEDNFIVRGTIRNINQKYKYEQLYDICKNLEIVEIDLLECEKNKWVDIMKDCDYILHVASPLTKNGKESDFVKPAINGTMNILKAAAEVLTIKRIVMTSSVAAISSGRMQKQPYTENDWATPKSNEYYNKSKLLAEKSAWDFYNQLTNKTYLLSVINPTVVFGPMLSGRCDCLSLKSLRSIIQGYQQMIPKITVPIVDVHDVAYAHLQCLKLNKDIVNEKRFILSSKCIWFSELINLLMQNKLLINQNMKYINMPQFFALIMSQFSKFIKRKHIQSWNTLEIYDNTRSKEDLKINQVEIDNTINNTVKQLNKQRLIRVTPKKNAYKKQIAILIIAILSIMYFKLKD